MWGFILSNKKFILNADDFGMSKAFNNAVLRGYNQGFLTSTSLCANGETFDTAVNEIIPECPNLGIGVHLNIIEGNSLKNGEKFNNSYLKLMYIAGNSWFLEYAEKEFRLQIEKVLRYTTVTHLDSHVHVHAIPKIFELTCKLAKEYGIKQVRTQHEKLYFVPDFAKHINIHYPPNILKVMLLSAFTSKNKELIDKYELTTNDYILGVGYTGMMDDETVYHGLLKVEDENAIVEALIHPCYFEGQKIYPRKKEFLITQNMDLKDKIQRLGFDIGNYKS